MAIVGAIIGDLAAWTYEHEPDVFDAHMVSTDAKLSPIGMCIMVEEPFIKEGGLIYKSRVYSMLSKVFNAPDPTVYEDPYNLDHWEYPKYGCAIPFRLKIAMITAAFICSSEESEERQKHLEWVSFFHGGKQEYYAQALTRILSELRKGKSKESIQSENPVVLNYYPQGEHHKWRDYLEYITFSWRCFYYSQDFNEAIINASKCSRDRHLTMALAGAFAEAYYGTDSIDPRYIAVCNRLLGQSE